MALEKSHQIGGQVATGKPEFKLLDLGQEHEISVKAEDWDFLMELSESLSQSGEKSTPEEVTRSLISIELKSVCTEPYRCKRSERLAELMGSQT